MTPAEATLVVVDGASGVAIVTRRVWTMAEELELPRIIVASRMDRDRASAERGLESLQAAFGRQVVPMQLPIGKEKSPSGAVDRVNMKAYTYESGGRGKSKEGPTH